MSTIAPANSAPPTTPHHSGGIFAAFRRMKGVINASESELDAVVESAERLGGWCVILVVVALVAEAILAVVALPPLAARIDGFTTNGLIALAVFGEFFFHKRGSFAQNELARRSKERAARFERDAAQANERAAALVVEAEHLKSEVKRLRDPRDLGSRKEKLVAELSAVADRLTGRVHIASVEDPEAMAYASQVLRAFKDAGVRMSQEKPLSIIQAGLDWSDFFIMLPTNETQASSDVANVLGATLWRAGFTSRKVRDSSLLADVLLAIPSKHRPAMIEMPPLVLPPKEQ